VPCVIIVPGPEGPSCATPHAAQSLLPRTQVLKDHTAKAKATA
jgi:hypothetical protein